MYTVQLFACLPAQTHATVKLVYCPSDLHSNGSDWTVRMNRWHQQWRRWCPLGPLCLCHDRQDPAWEWREGREGREGRDGWTSPQPRPAGGADTCEPVNEPCAKWNKGHEQLQLQKHFTNKFALIWIKKSLLNGVSRKFFSNLSCVRVHQGWQVCFMMGHISSSSSTLSLP